MNLRIYYKKYFRCSVRISACSYLCVGPVKILPVVWLHNGSPNCGPPRFNMRPAALLTYLLTYSLTYLLTYSMQQGPS